MNILLLSGNQLLPTHGWYQFYSQLIEYLHTHGVGDASLHCAYWKEENSTVINNDSYNSVQVPDFGNFNTKKNISCLSSYIEKNQIDTVFNINSLPSYVDDFLLHVKKQYSHVMLFDLLHSSPNLSVQGKKCTLKELSFRQLPSFKIALQWMFPSLYLRLLQWVVNRRAIKAYRLFDKIVVLSHSYIKEYEFLVGSDKLGKIVAIPNPLPQIKSNVPIRKKKKNIIFVGRLSQEKGIYRLLRIWKQCSDLLKDWSLIIVGDGPEHKKCQQYSSDLGIERIMFEGYQDAISYIDSASILCLTSNFEGLPTVFLEAMTLGVIPIGFDSFSAIYDIIDNWENGVIIPAFDEDKYVNALVRLASDDDLRLRMGDAAKIKVRQYDIVNVGAIWLDLFKKMGIL